VYVHPLFLAFWDLSFVSRPGNLKYESSTVLASSLVLLQAAWYYFYSDLQQILVIPVTWVSDFVNNDSSPTSRAHFGYVVQLADSAQNSDPVTTSL
jgi:hypothetical protein